MTKSKRNARIAKGVAVILILLPWILQSYAPQNRVLLCALLVALTLSLAYIVYHTGWVQEPNESYAKVMRLCMAAVLVCAIPVLMGVFLWPNPGPPETKKSRLEITKLDPIPSSENKDFTVRVFFRSVGDIPATNFVHRAIVRIHETPLSPEQEKRMIAETASIRPRRGGEHDELHPNPSKELFFSVPDPPSAYLTRHYQEVVSRKQRMYVFVVLKYRDASLAADEVRVTEFCGWFSGTLDVWGNCGNNRTFVEHVTDTAQEKQQNDIILGQIHSASSSYMPIKEAVRPIVYVSLLASVENRGEPRSLTGYNCVARTANGKTSMGKATTIPDGLKITYKNRPTEVLRAEDSLAKRTAEPIPFGKSVEGKVLCWMDGLASPEEIRQVGSVFELHFTDSNGQPHTIRGGVTDTSASK